MNNTKTMLICAAAMLAAVGTRTVRADIVTIDIKGSVEWKETSKPKSG